MADRSFAGDNRPSVVLICHEKDAIDSEGLARWLAARFCLRGIVLLRDRPGSALKKIRREMKRVGFLRLCDVLLFRIIYRLFYAGNDDLWTRITLERLKLRYSTDISGVPKLTDFNPNGKAVEQFIAGCGPDLVIARCKHILKPDIFNLPRYGTFVLHPGICPQYRNAHGCFWALVCRDLENVGMTLLKVDEGVDTGPVYLRASCSYDEKHESHVVIQYRVVLENLEEITRVLYDICRGKAHPLRRGRVYSRTWGQPWLTAYLYWKLSAYGALS